MLSTIFWTNICTKSLSWSNLVYFFCLTLSMEEASASPVPPSCSLWRPCCSLTSSLEHWRSRFWIWCRWTWWDLSLTLCRCTSLHVHSGSQLWLHLWAVGRLVQQQSAAGGSSAASVGGTSKIWPGSYQKTVWATLSCFVSSHFGCLYRWIEWCPHSWRFLRSFEYHPLHIYVSKILH